MDSLISKWILQNWQRKLFALLAAIIIWLFVSQSITATKTLIGVPVRVVNMPSEKTIEGMFPNGILNKHLTLSISGSKQIIENLESSDIEVVLDASNVPDEWIVQVGKKNLVSLNPDVDLSHHVTQISHPEFVIHLTPLVTEKIPIIVNIPEGDAPKGYQFLGIWPRVLMQNVTGPQEQVQQLRTKGLHLTFNLNEISQADLDSLKSAIRGGGQDEVSYYVPDSWKKISLPFLLNSTQIINDPEAVKLRIDFLREEFIPVDVLIPIHVYYPLENSEKINPLTYILKENEYVKTKDNIPFLNLPLETFAVSHLFYDVVKNYLELSIIASLEDQSKLNWNIEVINREALEESYLNSFDKKYRERNSSNESTEAWKKAAQERFWNYLRYLKFYTPSKNELELNIQMINQEIIVQPISTE